MSDFAQTIDVSVVMACYTEDRWASIEAAVNSLRKQELEPRKIVVAVDNNEALAERLRTEFDWITVVLNTGSRGASVTRNRGVEAVETAFAAFLDDDEVAEPDWLTELVAPFADAGVVGTGGRYKEAWQVDKPSWFPDEFAWAVGGSYLGMPTETETVRNVWSGNMAVRTDVFREIAGFRTDFGKRGAESQPEDTDLCIRMAAQSGGIWKYVPTAVINHEVPAERASLSFFVRRCFSEGAGKALMSNNFDSDDVIDTERDYAWTMVRRALARFTRFDAAAVLQAFVMILGLAAAAGGFALARARKALRRGTEADNAAAVPDAKPARIVDLELSEPFGDFEASLPELSDYRQVWVLVRLFDTPIGMLDVARDDVAAPLQDRVLDVVRTEFGADVARRLADAPLELEGVLSGRGCAYRPAAVDPQRSPKSVTVVICTRNRAADLAQALESLVVQSYRNFDVFVVDNAPSDTSTREVADRFAGSFSHLEYLVEPVPGLSNARNCALRHVESDIVAWLDDDEVADSNWLTELVREFDRDDSVAAVSGSVVPAELETWPQLWFEQYGGHTKGRSFETVTFAHGDTGAQSPLYPLPPFGVGANMAFRTEALQRIGGFDTALGAGTLTSGGEDTLIFSQLLLSKETVVNAPNALTRHYHRRTHDELERQMFGYGVGLTAFYMGLLRWKPALIFPLIALAPRALHDVLGRSGATKSGLSEDFPRDLLALKTKGMLAGPRAYIRSVRAARKQARA